MDHIESVSTTEKKKIEMALVLLSAAFGIILGLGRVAGDDGAVVGLIKSFGQCWNMAIDGYQNWSSRVLVNFLCNVTLYIGKPARAFTSMLAMYLLLKSYLLLYGGEYPKVSALFICGMVFLFPFDILATAGWTATITSYLIPQACMIYALLPIKKILNDERIKVWEYISYCFAVIIAADTEQPCVVLTGLYLIAITFLMLKKKTDWRIFVLLALSVASLASVLLCPGNRGRDAAEIKNWFPTYGMLDLIDKADIGVSTTLYWLFAGSNILVIASCIMFSYFIWRKYENIVFRIISLIPAGAVLLLGPFKEITIELFPFLGPLCKEVDYYGAFNVASAGFGTGAVQLFTFLVIAVLILVEIILLNDSVEGFVSDVSLILMGVASRAMMGYSPTVYASATRTYSTLIVCLIAVDTHIFMQNYSLESKNTEKIDGLVCFSSATVLLGLSNLVFMVIVYFA